jgi:acyl-CoA reductase-like NAD-dependent aldehyde dehydrogenase
VQAEQAAPPRAFLIGGVETTGEQSQAVIFPYDGSEIGRVWLASEADIERALAGAAAAEPLVAAIPPHRRAEILMRAGAIVRERADALALQMTLEAGMAMADSRAEVERTAEIFEFSGAEARTLSASGELVPIDAIARGAGRVGLTRRFPVGVVLGITAFNAPLLLVAHKIAPAFAAGNPCIVRPAPRTPLSALALGAIMLEAGAPPEAVTILPSSNELAERMVRDERVRMISFTGSAPVGWYLKSVAATPRVTLELGGNGAVIVHGDADIGHAADRCSLGGFLRAGQACISVQRLYAHSSVAGELREALASRIAKLRTGDPRDEGVALGGLIDEPAAIRAMELIDDAQANGATLVCGGTRAGTVVEPTLLENAPENARVCAGEAFAPIIALSSYDDLDEVIERVNASPYGLQAGLFTNSLNVMNRAFERLQVGALIVNDINSFRVDQMPYGGTKQSGWGREGPRYAVRDMTEERLLVMDPR